MVTPAYWTAERLNEMVKALHALSKQDGSGARVIIGNKSLAREALTHYWKFDPTADENQARRAMNILTHLGVLEKPQEGTRRPDSKRGFYPDTAITQAIIDADKLRRKSKE